MVKVIYVDVWKRVYIVDDGFILRILISVYGRFGFIMDVWNVFDGLFDQNVVFFNVIFVVFYEQW